MRSRINSETRMYGVHIAASGDVFRTISPVRTRRRQGMQAALALARGVIPEGFTRGENGTAVRKLGSKGTLIVRPGKSMVPGRPTFAKCEAVEYNDLKRWQKLNVQRVAVLSLVDCGTDGFVVYDLLSQGHLYWAIAAGSLLGASMLVSSAMLSRMGKTRACWFQLVGLGAAYEAASIILFRKEPDALVDLADPKTGVGALKYAALYEALLESAPQLVLQVYIMMASGIGGVTVGRASSIAVSGISITMAVVAVDFTVGYQKDMSRVRLSIALLLARTTELLARIFLFACIFTVMRPPFLGFLLGLFLLVARIFMWSNGDAPATINALRRTWPGYLLSLVCLPSYAKGLLSPEVLEAPRYCVRRALVLDSVIASIMGLYMIFLSSNTWHNQLGYVLAPTWLAHVFFVQRMHHLYWKRHKKPLLERTEPRRPPGSPSPAHGVSLDDVEVDVEAGSAGAARSAPPAGMESAGSIETDLELARRLEALPSAGAGGGGHTRQWRANQLPSRVGSVGNIAGELALAQRLGAAHSAGKEDGSAPSQQIEAQPSRVGSVSNIAGELALAQRLSGKGEES